VTAASRRAGAGAVAAVATLAFVAQLVSLHALQWYDARVASFFDVVRGCDGGHLAAALTHAAPWIGAGLVTLGVVVALARGASPREVARVVAWLVLGLLFAQAVKVVCGRPRPGTPPWVSGVGSFPSGHVANAALCAGAALALVRQRAGRAVRVPLVLGGVAFIAGVALTRVYLGRHWLTDVTASVLLALAFWAAAAGGHRRVRGSFAAAAVAVVGLFAAAAAGGRLALPSPAVVPAHRGLEIDSPLRAADAGVRWVARGGAPGGFAVLEPAREIRLRVRTHDGRLLVLKVVGRPRRVRSPGCPHLEVLVDGRVVGERWLKQRWRTYAFALPRLTPGLHDVRVRTAGAGPPVALALRDVTVEGASSVLSVARTYVSPGAPVSAGAGRGAAVDDHAPAFTMASCAGRYDPGP
jgi:membrane-associated phospholipid phosphatase